MTDNNRAQEAAEAWVHDFVHQHEHVTDTEEFAEWVRVAICDAMIEYAAPIERELASLKAFQTAQTRIEHERDELRQTASNALVNRVEVDAVVALLAPIVRRIASGEWNASPTCVRACVDALAAWDDIRRERGYGY